MKSYGDYPDLGNVRKILVIKMRHLGDVLLAGAVFRSLHYFFPDAQIDACVYREAAPLLEGRSDVFQIFCIDPEWKKLSLAARMRREAALLWKVRKENYDLAINLTEGDRGVLAMLASRAKVRVGFRPKGFWQAKALTHTVKSPSPPRHAVERNLDALRRIGLFPPPEERALFFPLFPPAKARIDSLAGKDPFLLIHPSSRWRFKCWPEEKMRVLAQTLLAQGQRLLFSSGPSAEEINSVQRITAGLDVLNLAGMLSLHELGALIERSQILICVDSLVFHIANALQKRVVALFGPTSDLSWGVWRNPKARIVAKNMSCRPCGLDGCGGSKRSDCLETLSVAEVLEAINAETKIG